MDCTRDGSRGEWAVCAEEGQIHHAPAPLCFSKCAMACVVAEVESMMESNGWGT